MLRPKMVHGHSNPSIKDILRIGFLSMLCLCLIWTHQAYASSTHIPDAANEIGLNSQKLSAISSNSKNNVEEWKEETFSHEQKDDGLSDDMISHNDLETHLPFNFELPIPFP
jgi:hypothetical protein